MSRATFVSGHNHLAWSHDMIKLMHRASASDGFLMSLEMLFKNFRAGAAQTTHNDLTDVMVINEERACRCERCRAKPQTKEEKEVDVAVTPIDDIIKLVLETEEGQRQAHNHKGRGVEIPGNSSSFCSGVRIDVNDVEGATPKVRALTQESSNKRAGRRGPTDMGAVLGAWHSGCQDERPWSTTCVNSLHRI